MQDVPIENQIIDVKQSKIIAELPNDGNYRVLAWFGHLIRDIEKNEAKIQLAFAKFDPEVEPTDKLFGGKGFYRTFSPKEKDKDKFFEIFEVGVELIVFLKLGSIWRGKQEVGRVLSTSWGSSKMTFPDFPAALCSDINGKIFTYSEVFGASESYFVVPKEFKDTYLLKIQYRVESQKRDFQLIIPLTEAVRKFYFQSSLCVYGLVTGVFTNLEIAPFEKSELDIEIVNDQKVAHINFLHPELSTKEATLAAMLLYSKPALEGARLVTDTLAVSIQTNRGIISSTKFPFDSGLVTLEARYKKVALGDGTWAFLILEIIKCSGERAFDIVNPHSPFWRKQSDENGPPVKYPPNIKFNNMVEAGFTGLDSGLSADPKMQRVHLTIEEDLTSGYGGISILKTKELPKGYKSHRLDVYVNSEFKKLATGFGDKKIKSEAPGTNIGGNPSSTSKGNDKSKGELIEVASLEFFKRAIENVKNLHSPELKPLIFDGKFKEYLVPVHRKLLNENKIDANFIVFQDLASQIPNENKVLHHGDTFWSTVVGGNGVVYPRRAVIVRITFVNQEFLFFEFEKFNNEQVRTTAIANKKFLPFHSEDSIRLVFNQLCLNRAAYKNIIGNKFFHNFEMKFINHRYDMKEIYMTMRILETIADTTCFRSLDTT
jgi:hypothetical protein